MKRINGTNIGVISTNKPYKNNKSGIKGVRYDQSRNKWIATIRYQYKSIFLGRFNTFEEAVEKRKQAEEKYFSQFLKDN
jgi:hypothetical protein